MWQFDCGITRQMASRPPLHSNTIYTTWDYEGKIHTHLYVPVYPVVEIPEPEDVVELVGEVEGAGHALHSQAQALQYVMKVVVPPGWKWGHYLN